MAGAFQAAAEAEFRVWGTEGSGAHRAPEEEDKAVKGRPDEAEMHVEMIPWFPAACRLTAPS